MRNPRPGRVEQQPHLRVIAAPEFMEQHGVHGLHVEDGVLGVFQKGEHPFLPFRYALVVCLEQDQRCVHADGEAEFDLRGGKRRVDLHDFIEHGDPVVQGMPVLHRVAERIGDAGPGQIDPGNVLPCSEQFQRAFE